MNMQKGITPVVAIVLLLLLTISAAGAAFAFSQNIIGQNIEEGQQQAASSFAVRDISCDSTNNEVTVDGDNTGDVDLDDPDLFLFRVDDGSLESTNTTGNSQSSGDGPEDPVTWESGNFETHTFSFDTVASTEYRLEIEFSNGYSTSARCSG